MCKGISIHLGVDYVDEEHYGSKHILPCCANDAGDMQYVAQTNGIESSCFLNEEATSHNFFHALSKAAGKLKENDLLFISFSGHGTFFQDLNGDEVDGYDEGILLYDRIVIDDELYLAWAKFQPGVRILFVSDSCYSGTITKDPGSSFFKSWFRGKQAILGAPLDKVYYKNQWQYDATLKNIPPKLNTTISCSVLLLSASQENEVAGAGLGSKRQRSPFTEILMDCWAEGKFYGTYKDYYRLICYEFKQRKIDHTPNYYFIGTNHPYFEQEIPFTI